MQERLVVVAAADGLSLQGSAAGITTIRFQIAYIETLNTNVRRKAQAEAASKLDHHRRPNVPRKLFRLYGLGFEDASRKASLGFC